jgi:hypothetical protein
MPTKQFKFAGAQRISEPAGTESIFGTNVRANPPRKRKYVFRNELDYLHARLCRLWVVAESTHALIAIHPVPGMTYYPSCVFVINVQDESRLRNVCGIGRL